MKFVFPHRAVARLALLCSLVGLTSTMALAQEPQPVKKVSFKVDYALYAADASLRTLDIASTHALLSSPCKCFYEADPLAPGSKNLMPQVAFHYGMAAAVIMGHHELVKHHHPRLARILIVADIVSETWAVQSNYRQKEPIYPVSTEMVASSMVRR